MFKNFNSPVLHVTEFDTVRILRPFSGCHFRFVSVLISTIYVAQKCSVPTVDAVRATLDVAL